MRKKFFDSKNERLLYLEGKANENFWDERWEILAKNTFANPPRHRSTINITKSFLPLGSRVLEGGCGLGDVVYALQKFGYNVEGIDFAPKIVQAINTNWPHLMVKEGDVRNLPVNDNYYDGYWSFGVIEHFPAGYNEIALEMKRVLRAGGYLFLSFPVFNKFRQWRAKNDKYELLESDPCTISDFYQFALNPDKVCADFTSIGFELIKFRGMASLQCLAEDLDLFSRLEHFLSKLPSKFNTVASKFMDIVLGRYAGHSCLIIFRKK